MHADKSSVAKLDNELMHMRRVALRVATISSVIACMVGLVLVAGETNAAVSEMAVMVMFTLLSAVSALCALLPGATAYRYASILLCSTFTFGLAARGVMSFLIEMPDWTDSGYLPRFAIWISLLLITNFLFLSRRQALILSVLFYAVIAVTGLYSAYIALGDGELSLTLVAMLMFFVFMGVPLSVGMLGFIVFCLHRYQSLARQLEAESERRQVESERDDVTGCLNRRGFLRRIKGVIASEPTLLATLEIDNISRHLQILGGAGAHTKLAQIGRKLKDIVGESSLVSRWDGGRFYVLIPSMAEAPLKIASQLLAAGTSDATVGTQGADMTLSIGACVVGQGSEISDSMEEVDLRLFLAQSQGGNGIRLEPAEVVAYDSG